jgi:hypothetical protein
MDLAEHMVRFVPELNPNQKRALHSQGKPGEHAVVHVTMRPSLLDSFTGALQLTNEGGRSLTFRAFIHNQESTHEYARSTTLGAHKTAEIGTGQGRVFEPNDPVAVSCKNSRVTHNHAKTNNGAIRINEAWWWERLWAVTGRMVVEVSAR